jgi:hypothetical protein
MGTALQKGEDVVFPFGKLRRVKRHFNKYWDSVDDSPANQNLYTVEHELDEAGSKLLNGIEE